MKYLLALFLVGCASLSEVTLTPFPEAQTEYKYRILLPEGATETAIFWYYGDERRENIIYQSGVVPIKTGIVETEMYFARPGAYILTVYSQTKAGVKKQRYKYAVRSLY